MLLNSFIQIPGIGIKTEKRIWAEGILDWALFFNRKPSFMSEEFYILCCEHLRKALEHIDDPLYLSKIFSSNEYWRLHENFKKTCCYLDIESNANNEITVIGLYNGSDYLAFVNGKDMFEFEQELYKYNMIVTFNGKSFDLPILKKHFLGLREPPLHIDLKYLCKRSGLKGGLKKIEDELGLYRPPEIRGLNGYDAVKLWYSYQAGDEKSLELLITYNKYDCMNLEYILKYIYEKLKGELLGT